MAENQPKIRDLMPANYGNILSQRTGKTKVHIYNVVNQERTDKDIWPEVLKLAEETVQQKQKNKERLIKLKAVY